VVLNADLESDILDIEWIGTADALEDYWQMQGLK